jgi:hypothetical protein
MEKEVTTNQKPVLVKIADQLLNDQLELDSLAVQLSLGKAEAKDKFEEAKKQMRTSIQEFKAKLDAEYDRNKEWAKSMKTKLSYLDNELSDGEAQTKPIFEEKMKNIIKGLDEIGEEIDKNPEAIKMAHYYSIASNKLKLQLEIIGKKWDEKKLVLTDLFHDEMNAAKEKINSFKSKINDTKDDVGLKYENFKDEVGASFDHLKKAFKSL